MKKSIIIAFATISTLLCACNGTDKTNRNSDTGAAKGNSGPADTTKAVVTSSTSGGAAATPGSSDTSNIGQGTAEPTVDTGKNKTP